MGIEAIGSKPVEYKSNIRINFSSANMEDCRVKVTSIFVKPFKDGTAVVFGEFNTYLLFSYQDSQKHHIFTTEKQIVNFHEVVPVSSEVGDDAYATFTPRITCTHSVGGWWHVEVKGDIEIFKNEKDRPPQEEEPPSAGEAPASVEVTSEEGGGPAVTTVMPIKDIGVNADELLKMDTDAINELSADKQEPLINE